MTQTLRGYSLLFCMLLLLQAAFWRVSVEHPPRLEIVPAVPGSTAVKAIAFGDTQFFFRVLGFLLQNFGDTYGRYTPLKDYDYPRLGQWFSLLDTLDDRSNYIPAMASYYYSKSQHVEDTRTIVEYLRHHARGRLDTKWWWQVQAAYLANHRLHDSTLALELALPLVNAQNVPIWVNQMAAFLYEQRGEFESALEIMTQVQNQVKNIPPSELRFMQYFVEERLVEMEKQQ